MWSFCVSATGVQIWKADGGRSCNVRGNRQGDMDEAVRPANRIVAAMTGPSIQELVSNPLDTFA